MDKGLRRGLAAAATLLVLTACASTPAQKGGGKGPAVRGQKGGTVRDERDDTLPQRPAGRSCTVRTPVILEAKGDRFVVAQ